MGNTSSAESDSDTVSAENRTVRPAVRRLAAMAWLIPSPPRALANPLTTNRLANNKIFSE